MQKQTIQIMHRASCIVGLLVTLYKHLYLYWFTGQLTGQTALVQTKYKIAYTFHRGSQPLVTAHTASSLGNLVRLRMR